jgi:putative ABC transport system permease protein
MGFSVTAQAQGTQAHAVDVNAFVGGPGELQTLGLQLVAGRDFQASEYVLRGKGKPPAAIISHALAERLFHGGDATGRLIYRNGQPLRIVGVVAHLMNMYPRRGATDNEYTMLLPVEPNGPYATFVLRTAPVRRDTVLKHAVQVLAQHHPERIFSNAQTFAQLRAQFFSQASAMVGLLLAAAIGLLLVTAAGIAGLASFWVQQRTRSIGIRRALGATRADVLRYTHVENFVIVTAGVVLGGALAYGLNALLMEYYAMQLLPPAYLVLGAVALWLMGQLAVLAPSLHAGAVPPAVATRSV